MATHENLAPKDDVKMGSDRAFGFVFAGFFFIVGVWPLVFANEKARVWAVVLSLFFLLTGLMMPSWLRPLNRAWFLFGMLLHKIVSPLAMGLIFYFAVTPTALLMRLFGKDPLRLAKDPAAASYWIKRDPPGPAPESLKNQF